MTALDRNFNYNSSGKESNGQVEAMSTDRINKQTTNKSPSEFSQSNKYRNRTEGGFWLADEYPGHGQRRNLILLAAQQNLLKLKCKENKRNRTELQDNLKRFVTGA